MREELRQVLLNILEVDSISESDSIETVKEWDSLRHLKLMMAVEQRFGIMFDADEILELNSVQAIAEAVNRRTAAEASASN